jgi:hypothetical protein
MSYSVKTIFPKEERMDDQSRKYTTTSKQELLANTELADVVSLYEEYQRQGFDVNVKIKTPAEVGEEEPDASPFDIAHQLTQSDIEYKASLKIKNSGSYEEIIHLAHLIEQHGFDFAMAVTLKINEDSPINIDHEKTWMDPDYAVYKVTPKASTDNIDDLKALYDALVEQNYKPIIDIKPKKKSDEEDDFGTQLAAYPDGTEIDFTLKDSE